MKTLLLLVLILNPGQEPTRIVLTAEKPGIVAPPDAIFYGGPTCKRWARQELQGLFEQGLIPAADEGRTFFTATCENSV